MSINKSKVYSSGWARLKQQQLSAWQPNYNTKTVSPIFSLFGVLLVPLGVVIFTFSRNLQEIKLNYTDCVNSEGVLCAEVIKKGGAGNLPCQCTVKFEIFEPLEGKIRLYYELTNFYQNHREYVSSRDDNQLLGKIGSGNNAQEPDTECRQPFGKDDNGKIYFPCGAIANSLFNDTIRLFYQDGVKQTAVKLIRKGIAWDSDKNHKFKNPDQFSNPKDPIWSNFVKPRDWNRTVFELDIEDSSNNGLENEDLIVWMRVSALPKFRKLHRFIDSSSVGWVDGLGLPAGNYSFEIDYNYEVKSFEGTKSLILTEHAFFGGRNDALGIMMMSAGGVVLLLGLVFLFTGIKRKRTWSRKSKTFTDYGTTNKPTTARNKIAKIH